MVRKYASMQESVLDGKVMAEYIQSTYMEQFKNKKVLIIGGAGFIGSHLVDAFIQAQAQVTVLDNFVTGSLKILLILCLLSLLFKGIFVIKRCETVVYQQDYIFHLAAQVSVQESQEKPDYCYDVNVTGTHIILEALRITENKAKFIFSSSCAVYGNQSEPCHESMQPAPTSVYAYSKLMGELLCQQYYKLYGIASVCLRYF